MCDFNVDHGSVASCRYDIVVVRSDDLKSIGKTEIATGSECQGTTFCSDGKIPRVKRLMNLVQRNMSAAMLGTMLNQIWTYKNPKHTNNSVMPLICKGCWVAFRRSGIFPRWMLWFHAGTISNSLTRLLSPGPESRKHSTVCMIYEETL